MDESSSSFSNSSEILKQHLTAVHSISKCEDTSGILTGYKSKIQENLRLQEQLITNKSQMQVAHETLALQEAEFAFRKSEYEAEIESLKDIEADLRNALARLSKEKEQEIREIKDKFERSLSTSERERRQYVEELQSEVARLRNKINVLENQNEDFKSLNHQLENKNEDLQRRLNEANLASENKLNIIRGYLTSEEQSVAKLNDQLIEQTKVLEKQIYDLQGSLRKANHGIDDLKTQLQISAEREEKLNKQINQLTKENKSISTKYTDENSKCGTLENEIIQLKLQIDSLQTQVKTSDHILHQIKDETAKYRLKSYCSPIQRSRIEILKRIASFEQRIAKETREFYPEHEDYRSQFRSLALFVVFAQRWLNNTRNESNICDHTSGLVPFGTMSVKTPLTLIIEAKSELSTFRCHHQENEYKTLVMAQKIAEMKEKGTNSNQLCEAALLQLTTAKKCNRIMHHQIQSFVKFHEAMVESSS